MGGCNCPAPCKDLDEVSVDGTHGEDGRVHFRQDRSEPLLARQSLDMRQARSSGLNMGTTQTGRVRRFSTYADHTQEFDTAFPPLFEMPGCCSIFFLLLIASLISYVTMCSYDTVLTEKQCTYVAVSQDWLMGYGLSIPLLASYLSIPVVSVCFTYVHIWAALYMTFYPMNFIGCLQIPDTNVGCGWQGIIPSKAGHMAKTAVKLMTEKLIKVEDIIDRIDVDEIIKELSPILDTTLWKTIEEVSMKEEPEIWRNTPEMLKRTIVQKARAQLPETLDEVMSEMKTNINEFFDLEELVVTVFTQQPQLLNHMFITCGYTELKFIRNCGAYMGGAFGVVQVIIWIFYTAGWMLPSFGFAAGVMSNWMALKMIFEPVEPKKICGMKIQGLFLQRQREVAEVYAQIVADNVLYSRNIVRGILRGRLSENLFELLHRNISTATDKTIGVSGRHLANFRRADLLDKCKFKAAEIVLKQMPEQAKHVDAYLTTAMDLETMLREKLENIPSQDFEQLLHPVFQEDEWKLILMGGWLGICIGFLQWHFLGS